MKSLELIRAVTKIGYSPNSMSVYFSEWVTHSRQLRYRGRKTKPSNDKQKEKEKMGSEEAAAGIGRRALVLQEAYSCAGTG